MVSPNPYNPKVVPYPGGYYTAPAYAAPGYAPAVYGAPGAPGGVTVPVPSGAVVPGARAVAPAAAVSGQLPMEESYIENILRLNLGKVATIYMTFENNPEWPAKVFRGELKAAGRDHIIIEEVETHRRYLLLMVNLDYITFDEPLEYFYPPAGQPRYRTR